jgi:hypothetical protein
MNYTIDDSHLVKLYRPNEDTAKPGIRDAVGIEFGESTFSHNAPGVPLERHLVFIPYRGELKQFDKCKENACICDYQASKTTEISVDGKTLPKVMFQCPRTSDYCLMNLVWIEERNEWIGIEKESWMESSSWGSDDRYSAPKLLSEKHGRKILEAYNIPEEKLSSKDVLRTHPSKLEEIANKKFLEE